MGDRTIINVHALNNRASEYNAQSNDFQENTPVVSESWTPRCPTPIHVWNKQAEGQQNTEDLKHSINSLTHIICQFYLTVAGHTFFSSAFRAVAFIL